MSISRGSWSRARTNAGDARARRRTTGQLAHELAIIGKLGLAGYFLIVWDIVRFSRRAGVLCQGRGSAANSAVCFCLGITAVDPIRLGLLFERFLSEERQEAPDIDIDFAHRDREQVLQYVYQRYGRDHAAMVCEQISYRGRSAIRDACRVLGLSIEQADELARDRDRFRRRPPRRRIVRRPPGHPTRTDRRASASAGIGARHRGQHASPRDGRTKRSSRSRPAQSAERRDPPPRCSTARCSIVERVGLDPMISACCTRRDRGGIAPAPAPSVHPCRRIRAHRRNRSAPVVPIEPASMAGPHRHPVGEGRPATRGAREDRPARARDAHADRRIASLYIRRTRGVTLDLAGPRLHDQAVYDDLWAADTVGDLPGGEPRADEHAAAAQAALFLRSRGGGGDHPSRARSRGHGASVSAAPNGRSR